MLSFLDREFSVARPGFSRWLVPPAALAIHLAIGQVYSFSIFVNPLLAVNGGDGAGWNRKEVGYIFSIAIAVLGLSAALFGRWLESAGPRKAMFVAATCFGSGFLVAAAGAATHSLALIYLGYGVIGGVGLGLGYISPVSTLIKWFPDRPGLATGLAIMGFGGGAMIGSPLGTKLMAFYRASAHPIAATWVTMGLLYFVFMMFGVFTIRVPREGWKPDGMGSQGNALGPDLYPQGRCQYRLPYTAILAAVGHPVHERDRRHRHPGAGVPDDPGSLPWACLGDYGGWFCGRPKPL